MKAKVYIILPSVALLILACDGPVEPDPKFGNGAGTPIECIRLMEIGINNRDIERFTNTLSPDFTFYFDSGDVGDEVNGYVIPETWGFAEEERAIWNILKPYESGGAYSVSAELTESMVGTPPEGATEYNADDIRVRLIVYVDESTGLLSDQGTLEFAFELARNGSEGYWRITEWRDFTGYFGKGGWPLGHVLAYYYAFDPLDPA